MKITPRTRKLNETVKETLAQILIDEISDPRVSLVTITSVEVSSDLRIAMVYVITHGDEERYADALAGLESAKGRIRALLGRRVRMRQTPELNFRLDRSVDEGMRISEVLNRTAPETTRSNDEDEE